MPEAPYFLPSSQLSTPLLPEDVLRDRFFSAGDQQEYQHYDRGTGAMRAPRACPAVETRLHRRATARLRDRPTA
jgi:hypothetical protein